MIIKERLLTDDKQCRVFMRDNPQILLIQPAGAEEADSLYGEAEALAALTDDSFLLAAFEVSDWNKDLSPWNAPPVFGREGFGNGAENTLIYIKEKLLPAVTGRFGLKPDIPVILGGYSLAGLFSLWCAYRTGIFGTVAAVSPSVWFPGWIEFAKTHSVKAEAVYLSLGNKEEKTKNKIMSTVGDCIRRQYDLLQDSEIKSVLEWNEGNHFSEPEIRCARGFAWCMK